MVIVGISSDSISVLSAREHNGHRGIDRPAVWSAVTHLLLMDNVYLFSSPAPTRHIFFYEKNIGQVASDLIIFFIISGRERAARLPDFITLANNINLFLENSPNLSGT